MKLLRDESTVPTSWVDVSIVDGLVSSEASVATETNCREVSITLGKNESDSGSVYTCVKCADGYVLNPDYN